MPEAKRATRTHESDTRAAPDFYNMCGISDGRQRRGPTQHVGRHGGVGVGSKVGHAPVLMILVDFFEPRFYICHIDTGGGQRCYRRDQGDGDRQGSQHGAVDGDGPEARIHEAVAQLEKDDEYDGVGQPGEEVHKARDSG